MNSLKKFTEERNINVKLRYQQLRVQGKKQIVCFLLIAKEFEICESRVGQIIYSRNRKIK